MPALLEYSVFTYERVYEPIQLHISPKKTEKIYEKVIKYSVFT